MIYNGIAFVGALVGSDIAHHSCDVGIDHPLPQLEKVGAGES